MKRSRSSLALLLLVPLVAACGKDEKLRAWATGVDSYIAANSAWQNGTVLPGLRAYCELERHVYDQFHNGVLTPTLRYCPPGGSDPVSPPPPPPKWDD